jgi:hypothetical protein
MDVRRHLAALIAVAMSLAALQARSLAEHVGPSTGSTSKKPVSKTAPAAKRTGLMLEVAIIPSSSSDDTALEALATKINQNPAYGAYVEGDKNKPCAVDSCDPSAAMIFIRVKNSGGTYTLSSVDVQDGAKIGSLSGVSNLSSVSASDIASLLGTPVYRDGQLTLGQGYQQYLQIVPAPMSTSDPDYGPELIAVLAQAGITAVASSYTIAQLGSSPTATICANGERYLVYSVDIHQQNTNMLNGTTNVNAITNAYIADCVTRTSIPFWGRADKTVPTTSNSLLTYSAFLAFLIPHLAWVQIGQGALAFSKLVDVDPGNVVLRNNIALGSMQNAVTAMCSQLASIEAFREGNGAAATEYVQQKALAALIQLPEFTPFAAPTATPAAAPPSQTIVNHPINSLLSQLPTTPNGAGSAVAAAVASKSNPLDLTSFTGPLPPPLLCHPTPAPATP